jgi:PAS domain S-box-containing protein
MKSVSDRNHSPLGGAVAEIAHAPSLSPPPQPGVAHQDPEWKDLVYETAPLACLNFDTLGRIVDFNLAASHLLDINATRDFHRPLADFCIPRHHRRLLNHIRRSLTSLSPVVTRIQLRSRTDSTPPPEVEMSTRPASEALCYRTRLLPISGTIPAHWPGSDAKFRALVENSNEVVCIGAPDGTIFYTTPSVQRVLGYEPASWFGRNAFEIMHPDDAGPARAALRQLAAAPTGTVIKIVTRVRHADGSLKWVEGILTNLIGQPAIGGVVCNYRDITESRRSEEALRSSEQRYRLLAESLPELISIRDSAGHIEYCNSRWREYRGVDCDGPVVVDWKEGIPPEDCAALTPPPWENGVATPWEAECRIRRASDGAYRWHLVRVIPLQDPPGSPYRWLAIASDIHERKQAEQERERLLHQIEGERSELALQYAIVRVLAWAPSLAVAAPHLLEAFCAQLGWQAGALWSVSARGRKSPTLNLVHIRQRPTLTPAALLRQIKPAPLRKGQSLAGRVWSEKKPASIAALSTRRGAPYHRAAATLGLRHAFAFPIMLTGEVRGVIELFTRDSFIPGGRLLDIVSAVGIQIGQFIERTQALEHLRLSQEALIHANNALEHRVRERTAELHEANRELSAEIVERNRLEREIIRISEREQRRIGQDLHDGLCQELAAIAFMTGAVATRMGRNSAPETGRIRDVSLLLNESIVRCRDIARGLHPVEMDADGLMVALNDLAVRTKQTVHCTFRCQEPISMPESDMALNLYRIAQEAVNNAVKYSRATRIAITLGRDGADLRLSVSDNGRGIRARSTRPGRRRTGGGMGLHIMHYRARTMGATLRIRDRRPHGTEVLCLFPCKR